MIILYLLPLVALFCVTTAMSPSSARLAPRAAVRGRRGYGGDDSLLRLKRRPVPSRTTGKSGVKIYAAPGSQRCG
jgi:hypothetical protein